MVINSVRISSPDKILFKKENISKGDIALYYKAVASRMMPYVEGRILSFVVCPQRAEECFYHKNLAENEFIKRVSLGENSGAYITEAAGIIYQVQMNTIEFHVWGSRAANPDRPDTMVFDLDPDEKMDIKQVRQGVLDLKNVLSELGLQSFLKTSGNKGYHVIVPFCQNAVEFDLSADWKTFGGFAKQIAQVMEKKWPDRYTSNVRKVNRKGRIFIDWIRNGRGATSVAPYSVRSKSAKVSMPIAWSELDEIVPNGISMQDAIVRLKKPNPWARFFKVKESQIIKARWYV